MAYSEEGASSHLKFRRDWAVTVTPRRAHGPAPVGASAVTARESARGPSVGPGRSGRPEPLKRQQTNRMSDSDVTNSS